MAVLRSGALEKQWSEATREETFMFYSKYTGLQVLVRSLNKKIVKKLLSKSVSAGQLYNDGDSTKIRGKNKPVRVIELRRTICCTKFLSKIVLHILSRT